MCSPMAQAKQLKVKKKRWVAIVAPAKFNHVLLGETFVGEPQEAVGRDITISLMQLTGDPKRQSTHVSFVMDGVKDGAITTSLKGLEILPSSVKRLVRRNKSRVNDSFEVVSQDGKRLRVKPLLVTKGCVPRSVCAKIQHQVRDWMVRLLARSSLDQFMDDVVSYKLQKELASAMSKTYPVQIAEVRAFKVVGTGTPPVFPNEEAPALGRSDPSEQGEAKPARQKGRGRSKREARLGSDATGDGPAVAVGDAAQGDAAPAVIESSPEEPAPISIES